ncbi:MAG: hypothetical protein K0U98_08400 [Deltaproteobacteria bacterium]|nr:hypothetical protein [Deltaproteobacteria bacterium]
MEEVLAQFLAVEPETLIAAVITTSGRSALLTPSNPSLWTDTVSRDIRFLSSFFSSLIPFPSSLRVAMQNGKICGPIAGDDPFGCRPFR